MKIPTYQDVLTDAKLWRATNTKENRERAIKLLVEGMLTYPDALALGDELVLVHKQHGDLDAAIELLRELNARFTHIGEETLCRWGAVLKARGNVSLGLGLLGPADLDLKEAEGYYARAFEEFGTHYPRVNQLTVRCTRAGLALLRNDSSLSAELHQAVRDDAAASLADPKLWRRVQPHDAVWVPASEGELCFLLQRWAAAERAYEQAIHAAGTDDFPRGSMAKQIREVLIPAFERLGLPIEGKLARPNEFFGIPENPPTA